MPPIAPQTVSGPAHKVPCPWCGKPNNFTQHDDLLSESMGSVGAGDPGDQLTFTCDHCTRPMKIVAVARVLTITVRQAK